MTVLTTLIPRQTSGSHTGSTSKHHAATRHDAVLMFARCKELLLDVNRWKQFCGGKGATFRLTDDAGHVLIDKKALVDHYIRIELPAPENPQGNGYDWVRIEAFQTSKDLIKDEEVFGFRVRPAQNPERRTDETAHFYDDSATSTFLIIRNIYTVTVLERGKNERPNTDGSLFERLRNWIVAIPAMFGLATPQWKMLTAGILKTAMTNTTKT